MAKIKYDVGDVEEFVPYAGPTPKRGVYEGKVISAEFTKSSNDNEMFKFTVVIETKKKDHKQYNGCPLFTNLVIGDLSEDWMKRNLKQLVKTFGLKEKGQLDTDAIVKKATDSKVRVIVKNENSEEYGLQAKVAALLPFKGAEDEAEAGAEDDEVEAEADEVEAEEVEAEEADEDEEGEGDDEEDDGLDALDRPGLKKHIKENELDIKVTKAKSDDDLRAEIRAASADDEEDEEEDEPTVEDEIADLDRAGLKAYIKKHELAVTVKKSMDDDAVRAAIVEAWPDEDDEDGEEESGDEPPF